MSMTTPVRTPRDRLERLTAILSRAFRFWWVAAFVMVLGVGASLLVATLKKRVYTSETVLLYREGIRATYVLGRDAEGEQTRKLGLRLKEMVLARPRLKEIIDTYKLYPDVVDKHGYIEAMDQMRNNIVFKVREGDTFLLSYTDKDPETAQKVAARLAQSLIDENVKYRSLQASNTKELVAADKQRKEQLLGEKQQALIAFMQKHPEFAQELAQGGGARGGSAIEAARKKQSEGQKGDPEVASLEREASRIRQRLSLPASPRSPSAEPKRDPRLVQAKQEAEAELRRAQNDLENMQAQGLTEVHPNVISAKSRVKGAQDRFKRASDALASGELILPIEAPPASEQEKPALEKRLRDIEDNIAALKRRKQDAAQGEAAQKKASNLAQEIINIESEWLHLNDEVAAAREDFETAQAKERNANAYATAEESGKAAQIDIVDPAYRPTRPAGGGRMKVMLMGLLASMALAGAVVLACAIFDDRLYERADVEALELAPLLVGIPRTAAGRGKRG